ncbi:hypothetical protein RMCBS344292_03138 [Rhizopus microsporus]|nr:hypothetical protein RMCBS344292_03138 [Rhizopus microsporus]
MSSKASKRKFALLTRTEIEECLRQQKRIKLEIQQLPCRKLKLNYSNSTAIYCGNCTRKKGDCSFVDLRAFKVEADNTLTYGPYFPSATTEDPLKAKLAIAVKPKPPASTAKQYIQQYIEPVLRQIVDDEEQLITALSDELSVINRKFVGGYGHNCDSCLTSIFNYHYICATCAYEICPSCFKDAKLMRCLHCIHHTPNHFVLFSKYSDDSFSELKSSLFREHRGTKRSFSEDQQEFNDTKVVMKNPSGDIEVSFDMNLKTPESASDVAHAPPKTAYIVTVEDSLSPSTTIHSASEYTTASAPTVNTLDTNTLNLSSDTSCSSATSLSIPECTITSDEHLVISHESIALEQFQAYWKQHKPLIITDSLKDADFEWSPEYFIKHYGKDPIEVIDCKDYTKKNKSTVKEYFEGFSDHRKRKALAKKLGTSELLKVKDWPPTEDIANKFPQLYKEFMATVPIPEYSATDGYFNLANRLPTEFLPPDLGPKMFISYMSGKTNLHCDMTDAVNLMYYAGKTNNTNCAAAIWHIFAAKDSKALSKWLKKRHQKFLKKWHPIHSQSLYMDDKELKLLEKQTGIKPWKIYQNCGDAVYIPAGCPHQVYNCTEAIKCAVDFVSPENLEMSLSVTKQFSKLPKTDALQLKSTLLFTWKEINEN